MEIEPRLEKLYDQTIQEYRQSGHVSAKRLHNELQQIAASGLYERILTGLAYTMEGLYEQALVAYDQALEMGVDPLLAVFFLKALVLKKLARYDDAIATYDAAIAFAPRDLSLYGVKVLFLIELHRLSEVILVYDEALKIEPYLFDILIFKSIALFLLGQEQQSWNVQQHLFSLLPDPSQIPSFEENVFVPIMRHRMLLCDHLLLHTRQAGTWYYQGLLDLMDSESEGSYEKALRAFERAVELDPTFAWAWNGKGIVLLAQGRHLEAAAAFARAARLLPEEGIFAQNRNKAVRTEENSCPDLLSQLIDEDRFDEALLVCESIISAAKQISDQHDLEAGYRIKGLLLFYLQRTDEAMATYREMLHLNLTNKEFLSMSVDTLVASQHFAQALAVTTLFPEDEEEETFLQKRAVLLLKLSRDQEALESATRALEFNPMSLSMYLTSIAALHRLGNTDKALQLAKLLLPLMGAHPLLLLAQAELLLALERPGEALPLYEETLRREKELREQHINDETWALWKRFGLLAENIFSFVYGAMGNACLLLSDVAKAIEYYDLALSLDSDETIQQNRDQALALLGGSSWCAPATDQNEPIVSSHVKKRSILVEWATFLLNKLLLRKH